MSLIERLDRACRQAQMARSTRVQYARWVGQFLGHQSLETTMIYTHVMNRPAIIVTSPLDRIGA